ncbi:DDE-type integrase/transposase/recombinase [Williamsoniiplasma lucivorax]|uniref:Transposase n=1 Tax=Williamsoniiplasma lucivorax TaxID=209274 RepID=A0A2S5R9E5_9MOLU|nr:DDE-type integrase/transposase/recombinase [Williamsoniiplasma lucivorax]PPE03949.1 transposase [Williamsoniiplasma lucivorax]PPE06094.1 transposase [Williamsoniiplasma lucivorax]
MFGLSKTVYYRWLKENKPINRCINYELVLKIDQEFKDSGNTYGPKRIAKELGISVKKARRYMIFYNLKPNNSHPPKKEKSPIPEQEGKYKQIIKPKMDLTKFGDVFSTDITEVNYGKEKWYTCAFYHIKQKKVFGVVTKPYKGMELVMESFLKMVDEFGSFKKNSIIHSDNGSEFKSYQYWLILTWFGFKPSMSRVGKSTDNGFIEGFWSTLKREALKESHVYTTLDEYSLNLKHYCNFYNNKRITLL